MSTEMLAFLMGAKNYSKPIEDACIRWGIVTGRDKARFIAQLHVESGGFKHVTELTGYRPETLLRVFKGRNGLATLTQAQQLVAAGPRTVFNFVYGGAWGETHLGNTGPDDGWDYRGRGLIQLTGRANYRAASIGCYGDERLLDDPGLLTSPHGAADVAGWYWHDRRCDGIADIRELTRRINGGSMHLAERVKQTERAYDLLEFLTSQ